MQMTSWFCCYALWSDDDEPMTIFEIDNIFNLLKSTKTFLIRMCYLSSVFVFVAFVIFET